MNTDPYATPAAPVAVEKMPHSKLGVVSFVISIIGTLMTFGLFGYAGYLEVTTPGGVDERSTEAILAGLAIMFSGVLLLVGLILGLIAAFGKKHRRLFGILGASICFVVLSLGAGIMLLGIAAG